MTLYLMLLMTACTVSCPQNTYTFTNTDGTILAENKVQATCTEVPASFKVDFTLSRKNAEAKLIDGWKIYAVKQIRKGFQVQEIIRIPKPQEFTISVSSAVKVK